MSIKRRHNYNYLGLHIQTLPKVQSIFKPKLVLAQSRPVHLYQNACHLASPAGKWDETWASVINVQAMSTQALSQ